MMVIPLIALALGAGSMELGDARVQDGTFSVAIRAPAEALQRSEIVPRGRRVIVFVPGVKATYSQTYRNGPVKGIRAVPKPRGTPVVVMLNSPLSAADRLSLVSGTPWRLQVVSPASEIAPAPDPAPREPTEASTESSLSSISDAPSQAEPPFLQAKEERPVATPFVAVVAMALLALAVVGWAVRRRSVRRVLGGVDSIDVVATRAFGGTHRLALVETCGERLLLATSKTEVRVLSHLGVGGEVLQDEVLTTDADALPESTTSTDVAGIIELRRRGDGAAA